MNKKKSHILIVEDDEGIRQIMQAKLFKEGFNVSVAANGLHALQILRSGQKFDLIVSDLKMPGKSGLELLLEVRKLEIACPFVVLTAFADRSKIMAARAQGARDVLVKPIKHQDLLKKIHEYLGIEFQLEKVSA